MFTSYNRKMTAGNPPHIPSIDCPIILYMPSTLIRLSLLRRILCSVLLLPTGKVFGQDEREDYLPLTVRKDVLLHQDHLLGCSKLSSSRLVEVNTRSHVGSIPGHGHFIDTITAECLYQLTRHVVDIKSVL
jgi:hypothetical protein